MILGTGAGDVAFAWSSDDGLTWTDRSKPFEGRLPQGVAADGTGFIAFGVGPGAAWSARSADGTAWDEPVPLPGLAEGAIIGNPVVLGGEVVVFVGDPSGAIGMLRPDGSGGWRSELTNGLTRETLGRIVAVGDGLVALGGDETGPAAWISPDGISWRPLALPAEATESGVDGAVNGATIADGRAYLVGQIRARRRGGWRRAWGAVERAGGSPRALTDPTPRQPARAGEPAGQSAQAASQRLAEPVAQRRIAVDVARRRASRAGRGSRATGSPSDSRPARRGSSIECAGAPASRTLCGDVRPCHGRKSSGTIRMTCE